MILLEPKVGYDAASEAVSGVDQEHQTELPLGHLGPLGQFSLVGVGDAVVAGWGDVAGAVLLRHWAARVVRELFDELQQRGGADHRMALSLSM